MNTPVDNGWIWQSVEITFGMRGNGHHESPGEQVVIDLRPEPVRYKRSTMSQATGKVGILFKLGEAVEGPTMWPDYRQYGFDAHDVEDLLELVIDSSLHTAPEESNEHWVPFHAWRALGQLGDPRAIEPILGMFDAVCDGDRTLGELPVVLGMIGHEAIGPLTQFLNNRTHMESARAMVVDALEEVVKRNPSSRDSVVRIITDYLKQPDPDALFLNSCGVSALIHLEARESVEILWRLYRSGKVEGDVRRELEEFEIRLGLRERRSKHGRKQKRGKAKRFVY